MRIIIKCCVKEKLVLYALQRVLCKMQYLGTLLNLKIELKDKLNNTKYSEKLTMMSSRVTIVL